MTETHTQTDATCRHCGQPIFLDTEPTSIPWVHWRTSPRELLTADRPSFAYCADGSGRRAEPEDGGYTSTSTALMVAFMVPPLVLVGWVAAQIIGLVAGVY